MYYYLIPEKVVEELPYLEELLRDLPGFRSSYLKEILSIIALHTRGDSNKWIPLKLAYLRKFVPGAEHYLNSLRNLGIIERSGPYQVGITAYKYRWTLEYDSVFKRLPVVDTRLIRRIKSYYDLIAKVNRKYTKNFPEQNKFLRQLSIDPIVFEIIPRIEKEGWQSDIDKEGWQNCALASATRIQHKDITYSVDETSDRYHSNITNMPKELRPFVRINEIPLANIDIKNSQPYLSIISLTNPWKVANLAKGRNFFMMLESLQVNQTEDVKRWVTLVKKGRLYEFLQEEFSLRGIILTRDQVKKKTLKIMFSKNKHCNKHRTIFAELFPEVHRVFTLMRSHGYKKFPILLQKIEAHQVLGVILKRISRDHPEVITVTIHDSIMTGLEHVELVKKIMAEELTRFVGYEPRLKVEDYKSKINGNEVKRSRQAEKKRVPAAVPPA